MKRGRFSIVERIEEDLDLHAKKKKLLRLADAEFLAGQTPDLSKLLLQLRELNQARRHRIGERPAPHRSLCRLPSLMLRGWGGRCKDQHARLLLQESITLETLARTSGLGIAAGQHPPAKTSTLLGQVTG